MPREVVPVDDSYGHGWRELRAQLQARRRARVATRVLIALIVLVDLLSCFGSTMFLPKPVDAVIDLVWIGVNGAAAWCLALDARAWWQERSR